MSPFMEMITGWLLMTCAFVLAALTFVFVLAILFGADHAGDMMRQCMADGKPEYECYSMIYKGRTVK